jgi:hypothetical protein
VSAEMEEPEVSEEARQEESYDTRLRTSKNTYLL